jgi:hypothetical protein
LVNDVATVREEMPLSGGRVTIGVVRVGDTVRRPVSASSEFVGRLLTQLERDECAWAPRYLGKDESGRGTFSYMPGSTPPKWGRFPDEQVRQAALIIRQLHDMTRGSAIAADCVVCHNDAGPNNFVFFDDVVVGVIDFDMAASGDPLEDLGYMAWSWCISSKPDRGSAAVQARQVRVLADAYGASLSHREKLPDSIVERQLRNGRYWSERIANPDRAVISAARMNDMVEWSEREARYTEAHRADLTAALLY